MSSKSEEGYLPSGVWRIRSAQNTVYLAATPDVINEEQIPFPSPFYAAYRDSQEIYLEFDTDMSLFAQIRLVPRLTKWMKSHLSEFTYPKGRTLKDYLSSETIDRLRAFYGKDFSKHERMTPTLLAFLSEAEMTDGGGDDSQVEDFFASRARKDRKPIRFLDDSAPIDTALMFMDEMLLKLSLDIKRRGADSVIDEKILNKKREAEEDTVWRRGDPAAMERIQIQMKKHTPSLYEKRVVEGNRRWLGKLKTALQGRKSAMVFVDAANLGGKAGLLQLLQESGLIVEQMYGVDRPEPPNASQEPIARSRPRSK
jgi:uncharacterized protein YbaP (TraB family)